MTETKKFSNYRWTVCALIFFATTVNYLDRQVIGILKPLLETDLGIGEKDYSHIIMAFQLLYGVGMVIAGRLIDKFGTKLGYGVAVILWSIAAMGHALAKGVWGFGFWRGFLGVSEAGNFPAAIKTVAEWFPKKERALATGLYNGGSNVGTLLSPLVIPLVVAASGNNWRAAFLWTLPISAIWISCWLIFFRKPEKHRMVNKQELEYINSDSAVESSEKIKWSTLLKTRVVWGICVGKFMADPIWWFYLFWGAKFLNGKYGLNLQEIGLPFFTIYLISWGGGITLGWLSSKFLKKGWSLNKGRKMGFLLCAAFALPVMLVPHVNNMWLAVGLIALAAGGHCGWSANLFSLMSDIFPRKATASVTGIGGFAGAVGGALIAQLVGGLLQNMGMDGYVIPFLIASTGYFVALGIMHLLIPEIKQLNL